MPIIRPLNCRRTGSHVLLAAATHQIPGASEFLQDLCLQAYPNSMSMMQETIPNPRQLFLNAMGEREHYVEESELEFPDLEDRPGREFATAQTLFPIRERRASASTSMPNFRKQKSGNNPLCMCFTCAANARTDDRQIARIEREKPNSYVHPTMDVPWNSWNW